MRKKKKKKKKGGKRGREKTRVSAQAKRLLIVAKNWKHCSKIIFKCVNSIVGPIFNICFNTWTVYDSDKQFINSKSI